MSFLSQLLAVVAAAMALVFGATVVLTLAAQLERRRKIAAEEAVPRPVVPRSLPGTNWPGWALVGVDKQRAAAAAVKALPAGEERLRALVDGVSGGGDGSRGEVEVGSVGGGEMVLVEDVEALAACMDHLAGHAVVGVDIEQSSTTFKGFICTLQLSVPGKDYVSGRTVIRMCCGCICCL